VAAVGPQEPVLLPMLFDVALRPFSRLERVGEHSAVVWKLE
jgi:hypothetical protein